MPRLFSTQDLQELRSLIARDREDKLPRLVVCGDTPCQASHSADVLRLIKRNLLERNLLDRLRLRVSGCHGFCEMAPVVAVEPQGAFYCKVQPRDVPRIIDAALSGGYVEDKLYTDPDTGERFYNKDDIPFFKKQKRTLIGNNPSVDPIRLFDYLAIGGYSALEKALMEMSPDEIIEEVLRSGLRGRGGAGFPTGRKWRLLRDQLAPHTPGPNGGTSPRASNNGGEKYIVCNADEGDPGAYMDRGLLEGTPHSVIEGMIVGSLAVGATRGFIFVRHEYPLAIKNLMIALREARHTGLIGENILGTGYDFDIEIVESAGAFVCGEETALIRSIEGYMGEPRQRPPYPIERGIFGRPTCINNVETWANIPVVVNQGGAEYAKLGTAKSTGTKVFSVVGKVRNTGLVEVPMGITINEIVHDIGGGPLEGGKIKAIQIGGPSGGCIPSDHFDLPIDYDSLIEAGAIMGSGGMIVIDDNTCMVDLAKYFMGFLKDESCGKCYTCRKGTQRMYEILDDITKGRGTMAQLDLLEELAAVVKDSTMCGLGQSAPNPVLSTLRYFRHEYERHIIDKKCDAYTCKELVGAPCQTACPVGTEAWRYVALIANGEYEEAYRVIRAHNPFPSICSRVCDHKCEVRCRLGTTGEDPLRIRALKRFVTDRVDPSEFHPEPIGDGNAGRKIAVVGAGPAGLTAAHYLSLAGNQVTVFEAAARPGGMMLTGIPAFRLPRRVVEREIAALIDDNITLRCNNALGKDFTVDSLFEDGYEAVFLALGAHQSRRMSIEGEDAAGVYPSIDFLRAWNQKGENRARGRVAVIGGGNSAIDAARVAIRQPDVDSVSILYRRTRREMPAYDEEIDAALEEGITLTTLVSPVAITTSGGKIANLRCIRNDLAEPDTSGRRRPRPIEGTEHDLEVDTLIVAISEQPEIDHLFGDGSSLERTDWGTLRADAVTTATGRPGVFAAGDVVTGPNTVIDAVASGQRAAAAISAYLDGEPLAAGAGAQPVRARRGPFVEPLYPFVPRAVADSDRSSGPRAKPPWISPAERRHNFNEVERPLDLDLAQAEARRCLRCDLEFSCERDEAPLVSIKGDLR